MTEYDMAMWRISVAATNYYLMCNDTTEARRWSNRWW